MNQQKFTSNFINEFTDDEIKEQLNCLGFKNVPKDKFNQFKSELEKLITQEISMNTTNDSDNNNNNYNQYQAYTDTPITTNKSSNTDDNLGFRHRNQLIIPVEKNSNNHFKKVTFPDNETASIVDDSDCLEQSFASITTTTSSIVNNKLIKRKVVRYIYLNSYKISLKL